MEGTKRQGDAGALTGEAQHGTMGVIHIGFLSSKKIFSPDQKVHASTSAVALRFPFAVCGFAA